MPYIPRRFAPSTLPISPEVRPEAARPPTTPRYADGGAPRSRTPGRVSPNGPAVSPHAFAVSPDRVFKHLFGKELEVDESSGVCNLFTPDPGRAGRGGPKFLDVDVVPAARGGR